MAAIVNDRDIILQATSPRLLEVGSNKIILVASATNFTRKAGGIQPSEITIKPLLTGILRDPGNIVWTATSNNVAFTNYTTSLDKIVTLQSANVNLDHSITFTATLSFLGVDYTSTIVINSISDAIVSSLDKTAIVINTNQDGTGGDYTAANSTMTVVVGNVDDTNNWTYSWNVPESVTLSSGTTATTKTISISGITGTSPVALTCTATKIGYTTQTKTLVITKAYLTGSSKLLTLSPTNWAFIFKDKDQTTPQFPDSISFIAVKQNITSTVTFTAKAYTSNGTELTGDVTLDGTGDSRTVTAANFTALGTEGNQVRYIKVTATADSFSDMVTIWRGDNGSDALAFLLDNEAHTIPADSSGTITVTLPSGALTNAAVFRGLTNETNTWTFSKQDSTGLTTTLTGINGAGLATGTTVTITVTGLTVDSGTTTITATKTGSPTLTKIFSVTKSKQGTPGITTVLPGTDGRNGIESLVAYRTRSQSDAALTQAPGNTTGRTAPTGWTLTAGSPSVGQVVWYSFGRYNPHTSTVDGIPAGETNWSVPVAASIFQDIKSDNWGNTAPTATAPFPNDSAGYYIRRSGGTNNVDAGIYIQNAYVKGQLITGATGERVAINSGNDNKLRVYSANNEELVTLGGGLVTSDSDFGLLRIYGNLHTSSLASGGIYAAGILLPSRAQLTAAVVGAVTSVKSVALWTSSSDSNVSALVNSHTRHSVDSSDEYTGFLTTCFIPGTLARANAAIGQYFTVDQDGTQAAVHGGWFTTLNSSNQIAAKVAIASHTGIAVDIRTGSLRYGGITISVPPNNTTTYLRGDGTWQTISGGSLPSGGTTGQFLRGDGVWSNTLQGNLLVTGDITAYSTSDPKLKNNITKITNPLEQLLNIGGYRFTWSQDYLDSLDLPSNLLKQQDIGLLATEVMNIVPEAVITKPDGTLAVNYVKLIPLIIEALAELSKKVSK